MNDRIRNLLLAYDYSKSTDPLQPLASHVSSLLVKDHPKTSDIIVTSANESFGLHKFLLAARSPYFRKKLSNAPETTSWKLPATIPPQAFEIAIKYLYLGELPNDVGGGPGTGFSEEQVLEGIEKLSKQLEIRSLWDGILEINDRRLARQNRTEETERGRTQLEEWFRANVIKHKLVVDSSKASNVQWDRDNGVYADILLRADEETADETPHSSGVATPTANSAIPIGPSNLESLASNVQSRKTSALYPAHRAMLLRSEYFSAMFSSAFLEAQDTPHLRIITVDCLPAVLEAILVFIYTERADFKLEIAVDVLFAADLLLIDRLKAKTAMIISTLGNGTVPSAEQKQASKETSSSAADPIDPFAILRAGWLLRVPRLEEFAARYFAYRLERYIDLPEFAELVMESAARIRARQETDSIELVDDIRYYLSERFRLRFEGEGIEEMLDEEAEGLANGEITNGVSANDPTALGVQQEVSKDENLLLGGEMRTLSGDLAGDEFASDAINYRVLLEKIEALLQELQLEA